MSGVGGGIFSSRMTLVCACAKDMYSVSGSEATNKIKRSNENDQASEQAAAGGYCLAARLQWRSSGHGKGARRRKCSAGRRNAW